MSQVVTSSQDSSQYEAIQQNYQENKGLGLLSPQPQQSANIDQKFDNLLVNGKVAGNFTLVHKSQEYNGGSLIDNKNAQSNLMPVQEQQENDDEYGSTSDKGEHNYSQEDNSNSKSNRVLQKPNSSYYGFNENDNS